MVCPMSYALIPMRNGKAYPHIILTSDVDWDPSVLDHDLDDNETWFDAISDLPTVPPHTLFDELGDYHRHLVIQEHFHDTQCDWSHVCDVANECTMVHTYKVHSLDLSSLLSPAPDSSCLEFIPTIFESHAHEVKKHTQIAYKAPCPMFGFLWMLSSTLLRLPLSMPSFP